MIRAAACLLALALAGCHAPGLARVAGARARTPADPEAPAVAASTALAVPAGSPVEVRRETVPAQPATDTAPAVPARIVETITVTPASDTSLIIARAESGTSRAPSQAAALAREANRARQPLLIAALVAAALAVASTMARYPTPAVLCWLASALFFGAWMVAGLPGWLIFAAVGALAIAAGLYVGHEYAEKTAKRQVQPLAE